MASRAVVMTKLCKVQALTIDVCSEESHALSNTVTDHPVEEGFNISDHVRPDADQVTLKCFVANVPFVGTSRQTQQGAVKFSTTAPQAGTTINGLSVGNSGDGSRSRQAFDQLKKYRDEGTLLKVVTTLKTYPERDSTKEGMVIQSLAISRTAKNYDGLEFTLQLKQIRVVTNQSTRDVQQKDKRTAKPKHQGAKTGKDAKDSDRAPLVVAAEKMSVSENGSISGLGDLLLSGGSGGQSVP